jgi:hypothetical protein
MFRALLMTLVLAALVVPASASAACGPTTSSTVYDSPEVQVQETATGLLGCLRSTEGKSLVLADPEVKVEFAAVVGRRWLHTRHYTGDESDDTSIEYVSDDLLDLYTGERVSASGNLETIAVNGALITVEQNKGIVARYTDGRTETLDPGIGVELAASTRRLYWNVNGEPRTVPLKLPASAPALHPLRAHRISRCVPRASSRLLLKARRVIVTRHRKTVRVCFNGRWTTLGHATTFSYLGGPELGYTRPGYSGVLDANSGERREVRRTRGSLIANIYLLAAPGPDGLRMWFYNRDRPKRLTTKTATEIVAGPGALYWLDPSGTPRAWIEYQYE